MQHSLNSRPLPHLSQVFVAMQPWKRWAQKTHYVLLGLIILTLASVANAQSLVYPKVSETYFGANFMQDIDNRASSTTTHASSFPTRDTDQARSFMVRWGYREEQSYALELGYMFMPSFDATASNGTVTSYKGSGAFADLFFFFPITPDAKIYLKVGTAHMLGTAAVGFPASVTGSKSVLIEEEKRNWAPTSGAGVEYQLDPGFAIRAGWESIRTKGVDGQTHNHGGINVGGLLFYE